MKLSKNELNKIIIEEIQITQAENVLNESIPPFVASFAKDLGMILIQQMMSSSDGRQKMAAILRSVPDFFKNYMCALPEEVVLKLSEKVSLSKESFLSRASGGFTSFYKLMCRTSVSVLASPLYLAASVIELLDDATAGEIMKKVPVHKNQINK